MESMRLWRVEMEAWKYEGGRVLISVRLFSHLRVFVSFLSFHCSLLFL